MRRSDTELWHAEGLRNRADDWPHEVGVLEIRRGRELREATPSEDGPSCSRQRVSRAFCRATSAFIQSGCGLYGGDRCTWVRER
jgi:hypothetical protein